ncbi:MAG: dihydroorotase [Alphaproteobacteria bacterium]|nr:dihydroorotase [Alphaproteobacteria bacterium]
MPPGYELILHGATIVNHNGRHRTDIAISNGRIAALGDLALADAAEKLDCTGLHILPGVIDTQVHFREPGLTHKEDLATGSLSAVMGGVTGVFEMPNTSPATTNATAFADKISRATGRMHCDFAFYVGGTHENANQLASLEKLPGCAGVKVFMGSSTGSLLVADDDGVQTILAGLNRRAAFHSEDEYRLRDRVGFQRVGDPASHPEWRDVETALLCTKRLVGLAEKLGRLIHVLHISTAEEMVFLGAHKQVASVEVTPHHLSLELADYERLGTKIQMNPPVRDKTHQTALWAAIADGTVDVIGSDHAPHTIEEKQSPYPQSPSGMPGTQTLVPIMLDHVANENLSLERFVDLTSHGPQRLFGIAGKGRIARGYDGDFTIVDLGRTETITDNWMASKAGWTPYHGRKVTGWPVGTIVRGNKVMWQGELVDAGRGAPIRFDQALPARI